mmetsp:Transcript_17327/g.47032  ORF Transcript_17327/g.47032 Transcript_17327/m.47032 type:complete len:148 (-) Transcript_17327:890-1333(-)
MLNKLRARRRPSRNSRRTRKTPHPPKLSGWLLAWREYQPTKYKKRANHSPRPVDTMEYRASMSKSLKPSSTDAMDVRVATGPLVLSGLRAELVSAEGRAGGLPIEAGGVRADRHVPLLLCPFGAWLAQEVPEPGSLLRSARVLEETR